MLLRKYSKHKRSKKKEILKLKTKMVQQLQESQYRTAMIENKMTIHIQQDNNLYVKILEKDLM